MLRIIDDRRYEDITTLKQALRNKKFNIRTMQIVAEQTSTAAAAEIYPADSILVTRLGKTAVTLNVKGAHDHAEYTKVYTLVYMSDEGVVTTSSATGTATMNATPVAFVPAVDDFLYAISFTAATEMAATRVVTVITEGSTPIWAQLDAAETTATQLNMFGVNTIYGRSLSNHADGVGKIQLLEYLSVLGLVKYGKCTHAGNSTTETRFYECSASDDGLTLTATAVTVKDFYRVRRHWTTTVPTANSHEFMIGDDNFDGDGGEGDVYSVIMESAYSAHDTLYTPPANCHSYIGRVRLGAPSLLGFQFTITCTLAAAGVEDTITYDWIAPKETLNAPLPELTEMTDVTFKILKVVDSNHVTVTADIDIIEAF